MYSAATCCLLEFVLKVSIKHSLLVSPSQRLISDMTFHAH